MGLWTILVIVCLPFAVTSHSQTPSSLPRDSNPQNENSDVGQLIPIDHQRCLSMKRQTRYITLPMPYLCRPGKPGGIPVPDKMNSDVSLVLFGLHSEGYRLCQHEVRTKIHRYIPVPVCCPGWAKDPVGGCTISTFLMKKGFCLNGGIPVMKNGPPACLCAPGFTGPVCQFKEAATSPAMPELRPTQFSRTLMAPSRPSFNHQNRRMNNQGPIMPQTRVPLKQRSKLDMMKANKVPMPESTANHRMYPVNNMQNRMMPPPYGRMMPPSNRMTPNRRMMSPNSRMMSPNSRMMPPNLRMMPPNRRMMPSRYGMGSPRNMMRPQYPGMRTPVQYGGLMRNRSPQGLQRFHTIKLPLSPFQLMRARLSPDGQSILVPCRLNPRMFHVIELSEPINPNQFSSRQRMQPVIIQKLMAETAKQFTGIPNTLPPKIVKQVSQVIESARKLNPMINPAAINPVPLPNHPRPVVAPPVVLPNRPGVQVPENQPQMPRRVQMMMGDENALDRCRRILEVGVSRCFREAGVIAAPSDIFNPQNPSLAGRICGLGGRVGPCIMAGETACGGGMRIMMTRRMLSQLLGAISSFCQNAGGNIRMDSSRGRMPPGPMFRNRPQQGRFQPENNDISGPNIPVRANNIPETSMYPGNMNSPQRQVPQMISGQKQNANNEPQNDISGPATASVPNLPQYPQPNMPEEPRNIITDGPNSDVPHIGGSSGPPRPADLEGELHNLVVDPQLECLNGGQLVPEEGVAVCLCPPGFTGVQCEIQLEDVTSPEEPIPVNNIENEPVQPPVSDPSPVNNFDSARPSRLDVKTETEPANNQAKDISEITDRISPDPTLPIADETNKVIDKEHVVSDVGSSSAQAASAAKNYIKTESIEIAGFPLWMILAIALGFLFIVFVVCLTLCLCIRCRKSKSAEITQIPEKLPIPDTMFTIATMPPKYESQGIHPLSYEEAKGETIYAAVKKEKKEKKEEKEENEKDNKDVKEEESIDV